MFNLPNENNSESTTDYLKNKSYETYINIVNSITNPNTQDNFEKCGTITPNQFIICGDFLTDRCKTWTWERGEENKQLSYLPTDKQFLMSRRCPCTRKINSIEYLNSITESDININGDEWSIPDINNTSGNIPDLEDNILEIDNINIYSDNSNTIQNDKNTSEIDMSDDDDFCIVEDDDNVLIDDNILKTRTYDIYITYDQYHQCPRVYLQGYSENDIILTAQQMYEDISVDHLYKTVSLEMHPHLPIYTLYIHPCRHAELMKKFINILGNSNNKIKVEHYLFLFLKFVSSIIPGINYDFTYNI